MENKTDNFRRLIRNLRIKSEFEEFCKSKGLNILLAHEVAVDMSLDYSSKETAQKKGLHLSVVERYRKVLGQVEESRFNQFVNFPRLALLNNKEARHSSQA